MAQTYLAPLGGSLLVIFAVQSSSHAHWSAQRRMVANGSLCLVLAASAAIASQTYARNLIACLPTLCVSGVGFGSSDLTNDNGEESESSPKSSSESWVSSSSQQDESGFTITSGLLYVVTAAPLSLLL